MIVPSTRLLVWFAIIALPFATLATAVEGAGPIAFAALGVFALVAGSDIVLSFRRLQGVSVDLPSLVRATHDRPFNITVRIQNADARSRSVRLALATPPEILLATDEMVVSIPADTEWSAFDWNSTATRRGRFEIRSARVEGVSALGLWKLWKTIPVASEVRVYPNLARERGNLAALFLNRGGFGVHAQRQVGRGREFEKLRDYNSGDGIQDVHWKATAKRGQPVTKVFQIERTQEIYVVLDASRLSARKPDGHTAQVSALDRFVTAALVLGQAAEQQGDLFGLITFSDRIDSFLRAGNGRSHYHACRDALYSLQAREVTPDFEELSTFIRLRLRRRALLLFLTSLDDPVTAESFVRSTDLLARQHLLMVNMLQPAGVRPLFANETVSTASDLYGELAGHLRWHALRELEKVLQRRGVRLALLPSERLAVELVSQYLSVKQRQAL